MIKYDKDKLNRIPLDELIQKETGNPISGNGRKTLCPFHADKGPSLSIDPNENQWYCHGACKEGGDVIAFIMKLKNMEFPDACGYLTEVYDPSAKEEVQGKRNTAKGRPARPVMPIPEGVSVESLIKYISSPFWREKYGDYKKHWAYTDYNGKPVYFDVRFETEDGKKQVAPFHYSKRGWQNKQPFDLLKIERSLYNLHLLYRDVSKPVLLVEGCKCAADTHFTGLHEEFIVSTWPQGANGVDMLDVKPITDRPVFVWPDNDSFSGKFQRAGYRAAYSLLERLKGNKDIIVLKAAENPSGGETGKGYDMFDFVQDGGDPIEYINNPDNHLSRDRVRVLAGIAEDIPEMSDFRSDGKFTTLKAPEETEVRTVRMGLIKNEDGSPKKSDMNILHIVNRDKRYHKLVAYDIATNDVKFSSKYSELSQLTNRIWQDCITHYSIGPSITNRNDMISTIAYRNIFNSLDLFMKELKNELFEGEEPNFKTNPLGDILRYITFSLEPEYNQYSAIYKVYFELFDKFFIRMFLKLQCIITGNHDNMPPADIVPILEGKQGIGKSRLCRFFSYDPQNYYVDTSELELTSSRDTISKIRGKLIGELGELAGLKRTEIEGIKAFISGIFDEIRRLYSEATVKTPRSISFIGTTNEDTYLRDTTGNRRFWPVRIDSVNSELFKKKELVRALYVYYMQRAEQSIQKDTIMDELQVSEDLFNFAQYMREEKRVKPMYLDKIMRVIEKLEREAGSEEPILININDVADTMIVESSKSPAQFKRELKVQLEKRGYTNQKLRIDGTQRWFYKLEGRYCPGCNRNVDYVNDHYIGGLTMHLCDDCAGKEKDLVQPF